MWIRKLVFSCIAAILLVNGCIAGTGHVLAKDTSVEDWLEKDRTAKDEKTEHKNSYEIKQESQEKVSDTSLLLNLVKVVVVLGLILFLIYYVVKFLNKRNKLLQKVKAMENLGGISVGANKSVQIIRIGQQLYMLGVGDNVEMLKEITDSDTKETILHQQDSAEQKNKPDISSFLSIPKKSTSAEPAENEPDFKKKFMKELEKMQENRQRILNKHQKDDQHE